GGPAAGGAEGGSGGEPVAVVGVAVVAVGEDVAGVVEGVGGGGGRHGVEGVDREGAGESVELVVGERPRLLDGRATDGGVGDELVGAVVVLVVPGDVPAGDDRAVGFGDNVAEWTVGGVVGVVGPQPVGEGDLA